VSAGAEGTVTLRREPGILFIGLNRPEKRNALNAQMIDGLIAAVESIDLESCSVVVISGVPGYFSAGADISGYRDATTNTASLAEFTDRAKALCRSLTTSGAIVIAAVDGVAMGGGLELVLSADLVVATPSSRFALPEIKLGLIPGWGGTQRLVNYLGPNRAKESILLGEAFGVELAHELGIVNRVVPSDELDTAAADLARSLATRAPLALRAAKAAVNASYDATAGQDRGSGLETELLLELFASEDGREGIAAFVEKRSATFVGR